MNMQKVTDKSIEKYIKKFPDEVQVILKEVKGVIKSVAPETTEGISYGIPTFYLHGKYLVYFAGFKNHISVYPATTDAVNKVEGLVKYKVSTGTLKFPLNEPVPFSLIKQFVKYRLEEERLERE